MKRLENWYCDQQNYVYMQWTLIAVLPVICLQWSYGVLLWELLTRGALPYPDVPNWEVREYIVAGHRMGQPDTCPDDV